MASEGGAWIWQCGVRRGGTRGWRPTPQRPPTQVRRQQFARALSEAWGSQLKSYHEQWRTSSSPSCGILRQHCDTSFPPKMTIASSQIRIELLPLSNASQNKTFLHLQIQARTPQQFQSRIQAPQIITNYRKLSQSITKCHKVSQILTNHHKIIINHHNIVINCHKFITNYHNLSRISQIITNWN